MKNVGNVIILCILATFGFLIYRIYVLFAPQKVSETKGTSIVEQYKNDHLNDHNFIYWWVYDKIHGTGEKE
jgi:hypothetical protein